MTRAVSVCGILFLGFGCATACSGAARSGTGTKQVSEPCDGDAECRSGICAHGVCAERDPSRPAPDDGGAASPVGDAGVGGRTGAGGRSSAGGGVVAQAGAPSNRPSPADFADVSVPADFTEPVSLPPPEMTFSGDASSLVGTWMELNFENQPCTVNATGSDFQGSVCRRLDIEASPGGGYKGTLSSDVSQLNAPPVVGDFAPATDPEKGYPVELSPQQYGFARDLVPRVKYRLFDGLVRNDEFSFWVSPLDLWSGWCALQTPSPWEVGGKREYRCVPQTASEADTDLGKLALCTSVEDLPYCDDANGNSFPCGCLNDEKQFDSRMPLCSLTYCECSSTECHADYRGTAITAHLTLSGDSLSGTLALDNLYPGTFTFQRVAP